MESSKNESDDDSDFSKNRASQNTNSPLTKNKLMQIMEQRNLKARKAEKLNNNSQLGNNKVLHPKSDFKLPVKTLQSKAENKNQLSRKLDNAFDAFPLSDESDDDEDDNDEYD